MRPELSTLGLFMQAALPAAVFDPMSRARMLLPGGPALHVGSRARQVTTCQARSPPRHAACMRACVARRGSCAARQGVLELSMLALPTLEAPQLWSWSWRLGPECSGPGPALHVGSPAWLHRSWAAKPRPLHVALRASSLCCPLPPRPGALHAGALHAGGAPSCGLGAGVSGPDAQDPDPLCGEVRCAEARGSLRLWP